MMKTETLERLQNVKATWKASSSVKSSDNILNQTWNLYVKNL